MVHLLEVDPSAPPNDLIELATAFFDALTDELRQAVYKDIPAGTSANYIDNLARPPTTATAATKAGPHPTNDPPSQELLLSRVLHHGQPGGRSTSDRKWNTVSKRMLGMRSNRTHVRKELSQSKGT